MIVGTLDGAGEDIASSSLIEGHPENNHEGKANSAVMEFVMGSRLPQS